MSIVNDALKKAGKEFDFNAEDRNAYPLQNPDRKWTAIITASLVIIASLFGSLILYNKIFAGPGFKPGPAAEMQSTLNSIERKDMARPMKQQDIVKLNGIVYGDEGKWAIVNNRIVKEGDTLLGGEITAIARDSVRIQKSDGSEIILSLK